MSLTTDLLFITYNRLYYTKPALASVLADPSEEFSLTIWDNASSDGTAEYLKTEINDPRIKDIVLSKRNVGQTAAVNEIWSNSKADLVGKLDNDCILTPGWTRTLSRAHQDIDQLGVVACWHFFSEDFDYARAKHKIQTFGAHQILRHPWTCGTGLLIKRKTFERLGPLRGKSTTEFWLRMARAGYINGFYYPLIYQEHVDDPRSKHNALKWMSFADAYGLNSAWQTGAIKDTESYHQFHKKIIDNLLDDPWDSKYYRASLGKRLYRRMTTFLRNHRGALPHG